MEVFIKDEDLNYILNEAQKDCCPLNVYEILASETN